MKDYRFKRLATGTIGFRRIANAQQVLAHGLFVLSIAMLLLAGGCTSETGDADNAAAQGDEIAITNQETTDSQVDADDASDPVTSGFTTVRGGSIAAKPSALSIMLPGLTVTDFVVVSTRRTGRTSMDFVLRLKLSNASSTRYQNVLATLDSAPSHILVIDGAAFIGDVPPNATVLSQDTFTVNINLAISTSFDDFQWRIEGDVKPPPPPPPPKEAPTSTGIFMNIDDLSIPGESTSDSHKDWIELTSVMDGIRRESLGTGATRRRSSFVFDGLQVTKSVDRSTAKLRDAIARGTIFTEVQIDIIRSCGGSPYTAFAITLTIADIEAVSLEGGGEEPPSEEIAFNFTRIETMYTPVNNDCTLDAPIYSTQDGELLEL